MGGTGENVEEQKTSGDREDKQQSSKAAILLEKGRKAAKQPFFLNKYSKQTNHPVRSAAW